MAFNVQQEDMKMEVGYNNRNKMDNASGSTGEGNYAAILHLLQAMMPNTIIPG